MVFPVHEEGSDDRSFAAKGLDGTGCSPRVSGMFPFTA